METLKRYIVRFRARTTCALCGIRLPEERECFTEIRPTGKNRALQAWRYCDPCWAKSSTPFNQTLSFKANCPTFHVYLSISRQP